MAKTSYSNKNLYDRFVTIRQVRMQEDKDLFLPVTESIVEYLRPDLTVNTKDDRGKQMGERIVEGTAHFDARTMATWFVGNMVGPTLDWVRYRMASSRYKGDDEFNAFLQRMARFMLEEVYAYPNSNFYEVNEPFVLDGLTTGSPVMLIENDTVNRQKVCILPHYTENYLMRDYFGNDIAYHRKRCIKNLDAQQAFGYDNLPRQIQSEIDNGHFNVEHEYLMCIARAGDLIFQDLPEPFPIFTPWVKLWFCTKGLSGDERRPLNYNYILNPDRSIKQILPASAPGFWYKPFNAWHYHRLPHETYSRTPAWNAMPDVKGLNAAWATIHDVAQKYARPPHIALDSLKGKLKLGAQGVTWLTPEEYDRRPIPVGDSSNYPWAMDFIEKREKTVGRHFFADMARMIENYSRDHKQPPTAYQLFQMKSETIVLIGPAITTYAGPALQNIDEQFVSLENPLIEPTGRLWEETNPPDEIFEGDSEVLPVFIGPLVQDLKQSMQNKRILQPLMNAEGIFTLWPDSRHKVRAEVVVEHILEGGDFIQDAIVPAEEYAEIQAALDEERRQMAALEKMSIMADAVPKLQGASEEESPANQLAGAV